MVCLQPGGRGGGKTTDLGTLRPSLGQMVEQGGGRGSTRSHTACAGHSRGLEVAMPGTYNERAPLSARFTYKLWLDGLFGDTLSL